MTSLKLTTAEIRLLDLEEARDLPHPDDIFACRETHAAQLTVLAAELHEAEAEADAFR